MDPVYFPFGFGPKMNKHLWLLFLYILICSCLHLVGFFSVFFPLRYLNKDRDATMSILDIGLLTGFTVNTNDLDIVRSFTHTHTHLHTRTDVDL